MKTLLFVTLVFVLSCQNQNLDNSPLTDPIVKEVVNRSEWVNDIPLARRVSGTRYLDDVFTSVTVTNNVVYGSAVNPHTGQNETLKLNIYRPAGDNETQKWAIIFAHGGGFWSGSKDGSNDTDICTRFAKKGYAVFSINYRLLPQVLRGDWVAGTPLVGSDFRAAVRFVRKKAVQYGIDANKIVSFGSSAGSFGALSAAYDAHLDSSNSSNQGYASEPNLATSSAGALPDASVIETNEVPMYLMNCTLDPVVPFSLVDAVYNQAVTVNLEVETFWLIEECHTFINTPADRQETVGRLTTWIFNQFN